MSSLYYQHQQHEQQQQIQMQHDQQQQHQHQQQYQYRRAQHHHESSYHPPSQQSQQQQHPQQHYHYPHTHIHNHSNSHSNSNSHPNQDQLPTPDYYQSNASNGEAEPMHDASTQSRSPSPKASMVSHPSRDETLDTLRAMMTQERSGYQLNDYFPPEVVSVGGLPKQQNIIHGGWREKICQWSYNVVDHFDLPREIVSISLNYFDRYMASLSTAEGDAAKLVPTRKASTTSSSGRLSPQGSGDLALLASLGTLHLATKVHATNHNDYDPSLGPLEEQHHKVPSLSTLANLSRGQFGPASILEMEKLLLSALQWRLHPPTLYAFVTLLLKLVPTTVEDPRSGLKPSIASELFEVAMYVAELSVCDAFFVERQISSSTIALAAICTAMDDLLAPAEDSSVMAGLAMNATVDLTGSGCFTEDHRSVFLHTCAHHLQLGRQHSSDFADSLERLRGMYLGASASVMGKSVTDANEAADAAPQQQQQQSQQPQASQSQRPRTNSNSYNPPTSPSSIADMSLSTINSTMHSMADTTINGGGSASLKRGDSMVSSIACQSKETLTTNGDDELFCVGGSSSGDQVSATNSHHSNNFRYSPSPPREDEGGYGYHQQAYDEAAAPSTNGRRHPAVMMSCSPIVALR